MITGKKELLRKTAAVVACVVVTAVCLLADDLWLLVLVDYIDCSCDCCVNNG